MKISIFVAITDPIKRQDPFMEAMESYLDLADEVVIVNGGLWSKEFRWPKEGKVKVIDSIWPEKFTWPFIGQQFQRGYEACTGDWVIHCDSDYIFHENDISKIRQKLEESSEEMALSFWKFQFLLVDRYNLKSRTVIAVNRRLGGSDIRFDSGGDLCQPSYKGQELKSDSVGEAGFPFWNYDFCFKNYHTIAKDWARFRQAWKDHFGNDFGAFRDMMVGRYDGRSWQKVALEDHPKYIQARIKSMSPDLFGYSMFDWIKDRADYFKKVWKKENNDIAT